MSGGKRIHDQKKAQVPGLVTDERFARLHTDPRFRRKAKADVRVGIDKRFERMFSDKTFQSSGGPVDKRGRVKSSSPAEELRRYYQLEDDNPEGAEVGIELKPGREEKGNKVSVNVARSLRSRQAQARKAVDVSRVRSIRVTAEDSEWPVPEELHDAEEVGKGSSAESASEPSSSSSDDSDSDSGDLEEEDAADEEVATTEKETARIALVNLDWENLTAADIFAMLQSFVPKSGRLESVTVYPSEFGLARMEEEQRLGPKAAFGGAGAAEGEEDEEDEDKEVVMERLRKYEKDRLRYFFAVAVFDSPASADAVYSACDGLEFEKSSNVLDLRFIPDDMRWEAEPRDAATAMPAQYAAPDFFTRALQHSNVRLTWDDDEPRRTKALHRRLDPDELQELDFKDYLASGSEDEEEDEEAGSLLEEVEEGAEVSGGEGEGEGEEGEAEKRRPSAAERRAQKQAEKYRQLLLGAGADGEGGAGEGKAGRMWKSQRGGAEAAELEVTFHSGLDGLGERLKQKLADKEAQAQETVWEAHLRKKREKKKAKKSAAGEEAGAEAGSSDDGLYEDRQEEDEFFRHEDNPFADPFFSSGGGDAETAGDSGQEKKGRGERERGGGSAKMKAAEAERERRRVEKTREREEEARQRAELELLMMDEGGGAAAKGFNLKGKAKKPSKKERRRGKAADEGASASAAPAGGGDYEDPRFAALFTSHDFAVDPTDPRFSKVAGHQRFLEEKQRRRQPRAQEDGNGTRKEMAQGKGSSQGKGAQAKSELNMLVRSLKRKVANQGAPLSRPKSLRA